MDRIEAKETISCTLEFSPEGNLKNILWNAQSEQDEDALRIALSRLVFPSNFNSLLELIHGA